MYHFKQQYSEKKFYKRVGGIQVGTKLSWDPWMSPVSKILATLVDS